MLLSLWTQCIKRFDNLITDNPGSMRSSSRNDRYLASAERDNVACDSELNLASEHKGDLFLGVVMYRKCCAWLVDVAHHRLTFTVHNLPGNARVYLSCWD